MITYLPPVHPVIEGMHGIDGANSPMREVTRQVAFDDAWDTDRAAKVRDLFDGMAADWHNRISINRGVPVLDALARGDVPKGLALELGSGLGDKTPVLTEQLGQTIAVDLAMNMLTRAPQDSTRVCADAARLPFRDGLASSVVLINALLFPAEVDRVLAPHGAVVWVNTSGEHTPIHLSADELCDALPGSWAGVASRADRGTWAVVSRCR